MKMMVAGNDGDDNLAMTTYDNDEEDGDRGRDDD